jgi:hypothetical protein
VISRASRTGPARPPPEDAREIVLGGIHADGGYLLEPEDPLGPVPSDRHAISIDDDLERRPTAIISVAPDGHTDAHHRQQYHEGQPADILGPGHPERL